MNKRILALVESIFGKDSNRARKSSTRHIIVSAGNYERELRLRLKMEPNISEEDTLSINCKLDEIQILRAECADADAWEKANAEAPLPNAEQMRIVCEESVGFYPDLFFGSEAQKSLKDAKVRIAELQSAFERANEEMARYFPSEAKRAFNEHNAKLEAAILCGEGVDSHESWTLTDWEQDFAQKKSAYRSSISRYSNEAFDLVRPLSSKFVETIRVKADAMEEGERDRANLFKIQFQPSPVLALLRKTIAVIESRYADSNPTSCEAPKDIAAILG